MEIVTREEWGAMAPRSVTRTTAREIYLHHSVGSGMRDFNRDGDMGDDYMREMQRFHMGPERGWRDIAYNFAIDPDGLEVYEGRGWGVLPGSQRQHNNNTWSVVIMGDFRTAGVSEGLLARIAQLVQHGQSLGHLPRTAPLQGHRDAPGSEGNHCPGGNLYRKLDRINQLIREEDEEVKVPRPHWVTDPILERLALQNIRPEGLETMDMWRFLVFLDRHIQRTPVPAPTPGDGLQRGDTVTLA